MAKSKPKAKMPLSERAKQFSPFSALKGLEEALAAKEKIYVAKIELSDDMAQELNRSLCHLKEGKIITATYYSNGEYLSKTGMLAKLDKQNRVMQIVTTVIPFDDLYEIITE